MALNSYLKVASINIPNVSGFGNDDEEAYLNTLLNASKEAATEIVSQLNLRFKLKKGETRNAKKYL